MKAKAILLILALCGAWATADVKYTTEMSAAGGAAGMPGMKSTVYVKGQSERRDMNLMGMGELSTITVCAKRQVITVNWKCKMYHVAPLDPDNPQAMPAPAPVAAGRPEPARTGGVVLMENDIRDTGERQTMFGMQARRVLMKMKMEAKEGACNPGRMETESDMWLVNMDVAQVACSAKPGEAPPPTMPASGGCRDKFQMSNKGNPAAARGLPVKATFTTIMPNGQRHSMTTEIKDLSTTTLEASLFEAPAGFREASSQQELYTCGMGLPSQAQIAEMMKAAEREAKGAVAAAQASGRRAGVIPIGVVLNDKSGRLNANNVANDLVQKISAIEGFEGVRIDARAPADIQKEAVEKKCEFLLYGDVTEARTAGPRIGGILGRAAGVGGSTDAKHSLKLDYRLTLVDPFDQQVARDGLGHNEQGPAIEQAASTFMERTAERATGDARRWKQQQRK